nr:TonB-dependent receptor [uncultured Proteiniphilum sp.]
MSFFKSLIKFIFLVLTVLSFAGLHANNGDLPSVLQNTELLTGNVKTNDGDPLPGVTVLVTGTTIGTVTDSNGNFSFRVPSNSESLQFSFIGMKTKIISIGTKKRFDIILEDEAIALEEVVAVGYGVQKKESIVGSISQVKEEDLQKVGNVPDLRSSLTGQIPGLTTITSSGEPGGVRRAGSGTQIFIRGRTSWNNSQPLILIDGVERAMDDLDVNEVQSISVLKDASATAVFGVKGANGVIMITTKRGSTSKPTFSFSYTTTGKMISKVPEIMESFSAINYRNEAIEREIPLREDSWNDFIPYEIATRYRKPQLPEHVPIYPNVDWKKALWKDIGFSHRANLNIRGGSKLLNYFASFSLLNEQDMFNHNYDNRKGYEPSFDYNRLNFRSNLDFNITKSTKITTNIAGSYGIKNSNYIGRPSGNWDHFLWSSLYFMAPDLYLPQYDDGRWGWSLLVNRHNPVASVYNTGILQTRTTALNLDLKVEQKLDFITEGLSMRASLFYDNIVTSEGGLYDNAANATPDSPYNTPGKVIFPEKYEGPDQDPSEYTSNIPIESRENVYDWVVRPWYLEREAIGPSFWADWIPVDRRKMYEMQVNYARAFDQHNVTATGVFKREEYARGTMFPNYREDWIFRTTYDYGSRYLFEMNGAYNGSEKFGPGYRFDFFPSFAFGWYLSNEKFFNIPWIDRVKFRYSFGWVGDDSAGGRWLYLSQYSVGGSAFFGWPTGSRSPYTFGRESVAGNPDIHWEKALKKNIGVDLGFFKNRLSASFDYFNENRTDIFISGTARSIPPFLGISAPPANLGKVNSKGFELELTYRNSINKNFNYWGTFAWSHNENEVIFRDDPVLKPKNLKYAGYRINQTKSLKNTGFYNNWDEVYGSVPTETNDLQKMPGFYNLLDYNGDGIIKNNEDIVPIGYAEEPLNTFSYILGAEYKGFRLSAQIYAVNNVTRSVPLLNFNMYTDVVFGHVRDHWSKDNQDATSFLPRWKTFAQNIGDYYIFDASSIRLQSAEIAYTFNKRVAQRLGLSLFQVFLNGNNLYFWSKLPDDRESARSGSGASYGAYPNMRRFNVGININF